MDVTIISSPTALHQIEHARALAEGLQRHGVKVHHRQRWERTRTTIVACWGWRVGSKYRSRGHQVLVMERGYLGDRFQWSSLGWNGLNGRARFVTRDDPARFRQHFALQPWKTGGEYALLVGQVNGDASIRGVNMLSWYETTAQGLKLHGMPVYFRPHPLERVKVRPAGVPIMAGTLAEAMSRAAVTVCYNSNTAVDSVVAGVPAIVADEGSMAWPVAGKSVGEIIRPDRDAWAARLAWCQWTLAEIRSGMAWEFVGGANEGR